ncbi:uncharacterized protein LOC111085792 isoform X2 [Limulus polyphemus]|uniref:DNA-directed DNA polymerase n=1 Tax=Limulus polyphemus TaxID=6850 RepID=A0ABM1SDL3_LIMPO|nr:uncharacterized protein LOC111085792 isoform X2 [Limulus polyphemus]
MSVPRQKFLDWHCQRREEEYIFDFQEEIYRYCRSDVDILRWFCLQFRDEFLTTYDVDPFRYTTIASLCMAVYRRKVIPPRSIALISNHRYFTTNNYSQKS